MKENIYNTTNNRVYNIIFSHWYGGDWLEDKKNKCYTTYWRSRPYRSWKTNRKTQWKDK